MILNER